MKAKIDKSGRLLIERAGNMVAQCCPFDSSDGGYECGDWCPLFGEPKSEYTMENGKRGAIISLQLCRRELALESCADDRVTT